MTAYAIAHLRTPTINDEVLEYMERVQETLDPFDGRFIVHGAMPKVFEGAWPGTIVIVEFPDIDAARSWYESPEYQEIIPLRARHIEADIIQIDGVTKNYDPAITAAKFRAREAAAGR